MISVDKMLELLNVAVEKLGAKKPEGYDEIDIACCMLDCIDDLDQLCLRPTIDMSAHGSPPSDAMRTIGDSADGWLYVDWDDDDASPATKQWLLSEFGPIAREHMHWILWQS